MKKILLVAALGSVAAFSQAAFSVELDNAFQQVALPGSGSTTLTFSGTIDVFLSNWDIDGATVEFAGLDGGSDFLTATFDSAFLAYLGSGPGVDYTGNLFEVTINSSNLAGDHYYNNGASGISQFAEFIVNGSDGTNSFQDQENYGVKVNAVPEPASMAVLGLGAAALLRKRRK